MNKSNSLEVKVKIFKFANFFKVFSLCDSSFFFSQHTKIWPVSHIFCTSLNYVYLTNMLEKIFLVLARMNVWYDIGMFLYWHVWGYWYVSFLARVMILVRLLARMMACDTLTVYSFIGMCFLIGALLTM